MYSIRENFCKFTLYLIGPYYNSYISKLGSTDSNKYSSNVIANVLANKCSRKCSTNVLVAYVLKVITLTCPKESQSKLLNQFRFWKNYKERVQEICVHTFLE